MHHFSDEQNEQTSSVGITLQEEVIEYIFAIDTNSNGTNGINAVTKNETKAAGFADGGNIGTAYIVCFL